MGGRRKTYEDPETGRLVRICGQCGEPKDYETDFAIAARGDDGTVTRRRYYCKPCDVEYKRERTRRRKIEDPSWAARQRAYNAAMQRRWRTANPSKERAKRKRWLDGLRKNPQRHAEFLEMRRIEYHLRREREGHRVVGLRSARMAEDFTPELPITPFARLIRRLAQEYGGIEVLALELHIHSRTVRRWLGEAATIRFDSADAVLTHIGLAWWDVWTEDEYPELHARLAA